MPELSCAEAVELSAELALGVADAQDRMAVLAHVEHCAACAAALRSMTDVADGLAALMPSSAPPVGFEGRVLGAISSASESRPRRPFLTRARQRPIAVAAAVVVAAALAFGGWAVGRSTPAPSSRVATEALVSRRTTVGQVVVVRGANPWISMTVHVPAAITRVRCQVREDDGQLRTVGTFSIVAGYGYWAAPLPYGASVRAARVVTPSGQLLGSAKISAP